MELCDKALKVFVFMASCQNTLIISAPAWVVRSLRAGEGNSQLLKDEPPRIDMRRLTSPEELICDLYDGTKQGAGITGTAAEIPAGISSVNGGDGSFFKRN